MASPICTNCNDTGFEDYESIPPEIADDRFAEIVDWIASSRLEFEDASCCCHINPPCSKCVNTHHVAVCDKCSKASVLEAMDSIRSATETLQETWERHARQAADLRQHGANWRESSERYASQIRELQKKVVEADTARDQAEAALKAEQDAHRRTKQELNWVFNSPPAWKRLLTRWRKPFLYTESCDYCEGTGRQVPPF